MISTARSIPCARCDSSRLMTISSGFAERNWNPRPAVFEGGLAEKNHVTLALELGGAVLLQIFFEALEPALDDPEVRENQLVFHRLRIARGIDGAARMRHRRILEGANDVHEGVGVLVGGDVDERRGAAGARRHREVGELHRRRHPLLRVVHRREAIEPRVGHLRDADGRLALAVRRAPGFPDAGHELKEGGLAAGSEANEDCSEHGRNPHRIPTGCASGLNQVSVGSRSGLRQVSIRCASDAVPCSLYQTGD